MPGGEDVPGGFVGEVDVMDGSGGGDDVFDQAGVGEVVVAEGGGAVGDGFEAAVVGLYP